MNWSKGEEVDGFLKFSGFLGSEKVWGIGWGPPEEALGRLGDSDTQETCGDLPERSSQGGEEVALLR